MNFVIAWMAWKSVGNLARNHQFLNPLPKFEIIVLDSELPFSCWSKSKIQLATASFCDYVCIFSFRRYLWNHINEEKAYCIESLNSRVVKLSIRCSSASWSIQRIEFLCMLQIPNQVVRSILAPCSWIDLTLLSTILVRCSSHDLRYGKGYWSDPNHQIVMLSWLSPGLCMVSMDWGKSKDDAVPGSDGGTPNGTIIIIIWWDCSSHKIQQAAHTIHKNP